MIGPLLSFLFVGSLLYSRSYAIHPVLDHLNRTIHDKALATFRQSLEIALTPKLMGHIFLDPLIEGTSLEGTYSKTVCDFLRNFSKFTPPHIQEKMNNFLDHVSLLPLEALESDDPNAMKPLAENALKAIYKLLPGESHYVEGGWKGHLVLYQFKKLENGNLDISILNTGEGSEFHGMITSKKPADPLRKSRENSIYKVTMKEISPEQIGIFEDGTVASDFLQKLLFLRQKACKNENPQKTVYLETFGPLSKGRIFYEGSPVKQQFSGTCGWKTMFYAALQSELNEEEFSFLELALKKTSLDLFLSNSKQSITSQAVFEESKKQFTKTIISLFPNQINLEEQNFLLPPIYPKQIPFLQLPGSIAFFQLKHATPLNIPIINLPSVEKKKRSNVETQESLGDPEAFKSISRLILEFSNIINTSGETYRKRRHLQIARLNALAYSLPLSDLKRYTQKASSQQLEVCLKLLRRVLWEYAYGEHNTRFQNAIWIFFAFAHELITTIHPNLKEYGVTITPLQNLFSEASTIVFSSEDLKKYEEIIAYFEVINQGKKQENMLFDDIRMQKEGFIKGKQAPYGEAKLFLPYIEESKSFEKNYNAHIRPLGGSKSDYKTALAIFSVSDLEREDPLFLWYEIAYLAQKSVTRICSHLLDFNIFDGSRFKKKYYDSETGPSHIYPKPSLFDLDPEHNTSALVRERKTPQDTIPLDPKALLSKETNHIFQENPIYISPPLEAKLSAITCAKTLQCMKILLYFSGDNILRLSDPKDQDILLSVLFQFTLDPTKSKVNVPIHEAIKNPNFIEVAQKFLQLGIDRFATALEKPDVKTIFFFADISRRLKQLDPTLPFVDFSKYLDEWIENPKWMWTEEETAILHLSRFLQYAPYEKQLKELKSKEIENHPFIDKLLTSWIYSGHYASKLPKNWRIIQCKYDALDLSYTLLPLWQNLPQNCLEKVIYNSLKEKKKGSWKVKSHFDDLASMQYYLAENYTPILFHQLRRPSDCPRIWWDLKGIGIKSEYEDDSCVYLRSSQSDFLTSVLDESDKIVTFYHPSNAKCFYRITQIDGEKETEFTLFPLEGEILVNGIRSNFIPQRLEIEKPYYKEIFQNEELYGRFIDSTYCFTDSQGYDFKVDTKLEQTVLIFEDEEYTYIENQKKNELFSTQIPHPILSDNLIFYSKKTEQYLFLDKKNRSPSFFLQNGILLSKEKKRISSLLEIPKDHPIYFFEGKQWIVVVRKEENQDIIQFPRFHSLSGQMLELFIQKDGAVTWRQDPNNPFFVLEKPPNALPHLFGICSNFLLLQNKFGEKKLLTACKPIVASKEFAPHCEIDTTAKDVPDKIESFEFLEYDLKEEDNLLSASPQTPEAAFYKAYLLLSQKQYGKALELFQTPLLKKHSLSSSSTKILQWILALDQKVPDTSSSMSLIQLKAFLYLISYFQEMNEPIDQKLLQKAENIYQNYRTKINDLEGHPLNEAELEELYTILQDSPSRDRLTKISSLWKLDESYHQTTSNEICLSHFEHLKKLNTNEKVFQIIKDYKSIRNCALFSEKYKRPIRAVLVPNHPLYPSLGTNANSWFDQDDFPTLKLSDLLLLPNPTTQEPTPVTSENRQSIDEAIFRIKKIPSFPSFSLPNYTPSQTSLSERFTKIDKAISSDTCFSLPPKGSSLQLYQKPIQKTQKVVQKDYEIGCKIYEQEKSVLFDGSITLTEIKKAVETSLRIVKQKKLELKEKILLQLHKSPEEATQKALFEMLVQSQSLTLPSIEDSIDCYLEGNSDSYLKLNSHLSKEDIFSLDQTIHNYLESVRDQKLLERALNADELESIQEILSTQIVYQDPSYQPYWRLFLVFEARSSLIIRSVQALTVKNMNQNEMQPVMVQLLMGEGKTSVIAPLLLHLSMERGRGAFFLVPEPQIPAVREGLGNTIKTVFRKEIFFLQGEQHLSSFSFLKNTQRRLSNAIVRKEPILTTREMVQFLELEEQYLLEEAFIEEFSEQKNSIFSFLQNLIFKQEQIISFDKTDRNARIEILNEILNSLETTGEALFDEIQLLANPLEETIVTVGEKSKIPLEFIDAQLKTFLLLSQKKYESQLFLRENLQASIPKKTITLLLENLANDFFDTYHEMLDLKKEDKEAFCSFVLSEEKKEESFQKNLSKRLHKEVISLIRHCFSQILPFTLQRSENQNFGKHLSEEIVAFKGVGIPTKMNFASPWEAISYYFQNVLFKGISILQAQEISQELLVAAQRESEVLGIPLNQTKISQMFKKVVGISLESMIHPSSENLEKLAQQLKKHPSILLIQEGNTIAKVLNIHKTYLRSTFQTLYEQFRYKKAFSGTPGDLAIYPFSLQKNYIPFEGTLGKVIHAFLRKAQDKLVSIHEISEKGVRELLAKTLSELPSDRLDTVRALFDCSGFFRDEGNDILAEKILDFYKNNPKIQCIRYFGKTSEKASMTVLAKCKDAPHLNRVIGDTDQKAFSRHGVDLQTSFTILPQQACTGTNYQFMNDTTAIMTLGQSMTLIESVQALMRLRQFLSKNQTVALAIPKQEVSEFSENDQLPTPLQTLQKLIENEAISTANLLIKVYQDKIDSAAKRICQTQIRKASSLEERKKLWSQYRRLFVNTNDFNLFEQFGQRETLEEVLKVLQSYANEKLHLFNSLTSDPKLKEELQTNLALLIEEAKIHLDSFPSHTKTQKSNDLGTQMRVSNKNKKKEKENQNINLNVHKTEKPSNINSFKELTWSEAHLQNCFSQQYQRYPRQPLFYPLSTILKQFPKEGGQYASLFEKNIYVSHNFAHTTPYLQPVFSEHQKQGEQILIIEENGEYKAILISAFEAEDFFIKWIKRQDTNKMWLVHPNGYSYSNPLPLEVRQKIEPILWKIRIFNGDVKAFVQNPDHKAFPEMKKFLKQKTKGNLLKQSILDDEQQHSALTKAFLEIRDPEILKIDSTRESCVQGKI